jgi:hypothetical protein
MLAITVMIATVTKAAIFLFASCQPTPALPAPGATITPQLVRRLANRSRWTHRRWALAERLHLGFLDLDGPVRVIPRSLERERR